MVRKSDMIFLIVGMPRSGTNMLAEALQAGGMDLVIDKLMCEVLEEQYAHTNQRYLSAGVHSRNPKEGKLYKVSYQELGNMPMNYKDYRVVYIRRHIEKRMESYKRMSPKLPIDSLLRQHDSLMESNMQQLLSKIPCFNIEVDTNYDEVVAKPLEFFNRFPEHWEFDREAAASKVRKP